MGHHTGYYRQNKTYLPAGEMHHGMGKDRNNVLPLTVKPTLFRFLPTLLKSSNYPHLLLKDK